MKSWFSKKLTIVITIIACIAGITLVYIAVQWAILPLNATGIPFRAYKFKLTIPPRPGTQGIIIMGPEIEKLYFEIDGTKAGLRKLDWSKLENIDRLADVTVKATVNPDGSLTIDRESDVKDEGHPDAGREIFNVLRTWVYTPYKTGEIRFWFNTPSKEKKLTIETRRLETPRKYRKYSVTDRLLYYIEGVNEVGLGYVEF